MSQRDALSDYLDKRDYSRTPEPAGTNPGSADGGAEKEGPLFVIRKHDASNRHCDFRLEVEGVLKSWAVPLTEQIEDGHLTVWLRGEKVPEGYALTRTSGGGEDERWILVKMDDKAADARRNPVSTEPDSALTGRSLDEIRKEEEGSTSNPERD